MNLDEGGFPAFPAWELNGHGVPEMTCFGITIRDYFAAKAMQSMIGTHHESEMRGYAGWREEFAAEAYRFSDAMLKARK